MSIWRPASRIRVKALGLHWRAGRLLAAEITDDRGKVVGVRPLGGNVEFGERADAAVRREFREELGIDVSVLGGPVIMENLYEHEGAAGHEVVFIFEIGFPPHAFAGEERIHFHDDGGATCVAAWHALGDLDQPGGPALYPSGLRDLLIETGRA